MSIQLVNTFTSYELDDSEVLHGAVFTESQKMHIQNCLASAAEEKLALELDPLNPIKYAQEEASLAGQIQILRYLLDTSLAAEEQLANMNQQ